ncbi:hypothetical protein N7540_004635 [Penicillium herquei]|nr:hypothetical protein N7540_004635 [Penicillium herquei]
MPRHWSETVDWIWTPNWDERHNVARIVQFRRSFTIEKVPSECGIHISADTRYRLYVNGQSVCFGPAKSHLGEWNYETVDIAPFCRPGRNVLAVRVLRFSTYFPGNMSLVRASLPGMIVHSDTLPELGSTSTSGWLTKIDDAVAISSAESWDPSLGPAMVSVNERVDGSKRDWEWVEPEFDDSTWIPAVVMTMKAPMMPILDERRLAPRSIPFLPEIPARFTEAVKCDSADTPIESWNKLVQSDESLTIQAGCKTTVVLDVSTLTTAFLDLQMRGGAGAKIRIRSAECFEMPPKSGIPSPFARNKGDRTDVSGILVGQDDFYTCGVDTPADKTVVYEPFWFRTFRYIELEVETQAAPLELSKITFRETHYPLERKTQFAKFPTDEEAKLWNISINTLKNCMHETYEDCPYYEQNQFAMDSRLQILFTYHLSNDDRLARKCMSEFYASRRSDGLIETHFPAPVPGTNIPHFSLYWILMIHDHMMYFADSTLVRRYLGTIDGILDHFNQRLGDKDLVGRLEWDTWPFVDWAQQWSDPGPEHDFRNMAVPPAYRRTGVITYTSLIYSLALQRAAQLCDFVGRKDTGAEYRERAGKLNAAVMEHCFRGEFIVDGPDSPPEERSQHSQVFAVLCGALKGEEARTILRRALTDPSFVRCSYAMSFYVFEAALAVGIYDELRDSFLGPWRTMIGQNLTTWAESAAMPRSDCHAWSAVPIHDFVTNIAGLAPVEPGFKRIRLSPRRDIWPEMSGSFTAGKGSISISWKSGKPLDVVTSFDTEIEVSGKDGKEVHQVKEGVLLTLDG